ncbi:MAG: FlgD immunoglobulin-like domain containing protein [bacterium]|nr:FlgD immunoglobulin-like domain containing protein [bacterium]
MSGKLWFHGVLIALVIFSVAQSRAQDPNNITCINQFYHNWQDGVYGVAMRGGTAYLACGSDGLRIVDFSDPTRPAELGHLATSWAQSMTIAGDYAYVGDAGSVVIVNISDPSRPVETSRISTGGYVSRTRIEGNHAFIAASNGIVFADVADPSDPVVLWSTTEHGANDIEVHGNLVYAACTYRGMIVLDITDITDPQEAGTFQSDWEYVNGVSVAGNYAYLAAGWNGLVVVDMTTLHEAARIDSFQYAMGVDVVDGRCYINYGNPECPLAVVDVSNPLAPQTLGIYDPPSDLFSFEVAGDLVYVADVYHGLRIVSIADPTDPTEIRRYSRYGEDRDVVVLGSLAYVREDYKLKIVDISDMHNPHELGYYEMDWAYGDLDLVGSVAYLTTHGYDCVRAVDVSDPAAPTLISRFHTDDYDIHYRMAVNGHYGYLVENNGLRILDLSDPADLREVGFFTQNLGNAQIAAGNGYAFINGSSHQLLALSLTDPLSPVVVGSYPLDNYCVGMTVSDGVLYTATPNKLWVFSATSFANWAPLGQNAMDNEFGLYLKNLSVQSKFAYLTAMQGLYVFDVNDPAAPRLVGQHVTPGTALAVAATGTVAVVADHTNLGFYDCAGVLSDGQEAFATAPLEFALLPNYPNPFNASTRIPFELAKRDHVTITIFDVLGRNVTTLSRQEFSAGRHELRWDGTDCSGQTVTSGRYFIQVRTGDAVKSLPILYLR